MKDIKIYSLAFFLIIVVIFGCAKPNEPTSNDVLEIEQIYSTTGYAKDFYLSENMIFVAQDDVGFILLDRNNGAILEKIEKPTQYIHASENDSIFITYVDNAFHIYNFTNIDSIYEIGTDATTDADVKNLRLIDINSTKDTIKISYITTNDNEFFIKPLYWDIDWNLWTYDNTLTFTFNKTLEDYQIFDNYIYFAAGQFGFFISDAEGSIISELDTSGEANALKIIDNYAFVSCKEEGFVTIDISDKENLIIVYQDDTSGWAQSIDAGGDYLVVGSGGGGVYLYDISDIENPRFLDRIDDDEIGYTYKVVIENEQIFAATKRGIYKLKINR